MIDMRFFIKVFLLYVFAFTPLWVLSMLFLASLLKLGWAGLALMSLPAFLNGIFYYLLGPDLVNQTYNIFGDDDFVLATLTILSFFLSAVLFAYLVAFFQARFFRKQEPS